MIEPSRQGALISAGTLLGAGLGGFLDGIVLHQILQWHNMLSNVVPPTDLLTMKYNMVYDGVFHLMTWTVTAVGLALLWRAGQDPRVPWSTRTLLGSLALGWGLFNLSEGVLDHLVFGLHHVRPGEHQLAWDLAFLCFGALLVALGSVLVRSGRRDRTERGAPSTAKRA